MKVKVSVRPPTLLNPRLRPVGDYYVDIVNDMSNPNALAEELEVIKRSVMRHGNMLGFEKYHMAFNKIPDYIGYDVCVILISKA